MRVNYNFLLLITGLFLFSSSVKAQSTGALSLSEAVNIALEYNKNLVIGKAHLTEAGAQVQAAKDAKLPGFSISASYLRLANANVSFQRKNTGTGTAPAENPSPNSALYGIANASYPLYTGGKLKYNLERANILEKAAGLDIERTKENIRFSILAAYADVYRTSKLIEIITENYSASLSRDSILRNLEKNGIIARNDRLKGELHTSELNINLLEAQSNHDLAIAQLNILMGHPENETIIIDENFSDSLAGILPYDFYLSQALQNRQDKKSATLRIDAAQSGIKVAQALAYPNIALTGGYVAADIPGVLRVTNAINIGLGLQYNLSSLWKKNTELTIARARETEAMATEQILDDNIKSDLITDYRAYILATQKMVLFDKTQEQANENYRITKNKYDNNLSTINDLLDADVYVTQSKINKTLAAADVYLKYKKLLLTTGTLQF